MVNDPRKIILVADDCPENREYVKEIITRMGYTVREAENGDIAITLLSEIEPACIISDVCMPVKDGFELLEYSLRKERQVPVILTSSIPFDFQDLQRRGAKGFLPKPFRIEDLQSLLTRVMDEYTAPERRRYSRIEMNLPISIVDISGVLHRGLTINLSEGGILFAFRRAGEVIPSPFSVNLYDLDGQHPIRKVTKVWETEDDNNRVSIGGEFKEMSEATSSWLHEILSQGTLSRSH